MRPQRLVFHVPSFRGGGAERVWVLMANELAARGHEVTLFTWNAEGPNGALRADNVHLVDLGMPIRGESFGKLPTLRGLWRTMRFLRRSKPDAVYSAPEFANLMIALGLILARSTAKYFPSFHAAASIPSDRIGSRLAIWLSGLVAARATRAIAVSAGVGRDLLARGLPPAKLAVINNPLPPPLPGAARTYPWQAALAALGDGPVIVTAGRLVSVKDHATLLRAFALVPRPARLAIFGNGPLEAQLRTLAAELGIADRVLFVGYVNDPAAIYAVADLFALSSISEGFGNVLIEAMASGVPVVSTDCTHGPREILADGKYGPLVPIGDAPALAKAIGSALAAPVDPDLLKARAADFAIDVIGDRYEALLGPR